MKQIHIDNGQLGRVIQVIVQSMFVFNFGTFIQACIRTYDDYLKTYISIYQGIAILLFCSVLWWSSYYFVIYPSIVQYSNKQSWRHGNPMKVEFEALNDRLDKIEEMLKK